MRQTNTFTKKHPQRIALTLTLSCTQAPIRCPIEISLGQGGKNTLIPRYFPSWIVCLMMGTQFTRNMRPGSLTLHKKAHKSPFLNRRLGITPEIKYRWAKRQTVSVFGWTCLSSHTNHLGQHAKRETHHRRITSPQSSWGIPSNSNPSLLSKTAIPLAIEL